MGVALILGASVVEAVYYLRFIHAMWFAGEGERMREGLAISLILLFLAALVIVIGVYPDYVWNLAQKAGSDIFNVGQYIKNVPLMGVGA